MTICTRCIMPTTWRGLVLDENGVCNQCHAFDERQKIDWARREREFEAEVVKPAYDYALEHGVKYDAIVGFSGGKDSSWVLYRARKYGMTPLAVTFDHGYPLDEASAHNLREIPKLLGVDHITMTPGDGLRHTCESIGLDQIGDFCLHCHRGVGAFTARAAVMFNVPTVLWGEPAGTDVREEASGRAHFDKWFSCGVDLPGTFFEPLRYPETDLPIRDVYLGNYELWDQWEHADILEEELGWKRAKRDGSPVDWDKVDCVMEPLRYWQGKLRGGANHAAFTLSKGIRLGRITREEALKIAESMEDWQPENLEWYLAQLGVKEFMGRQ